MKLSFRLSALSAVLLLAPLALAQQLASAPRPIKDRLELTSPGTPTSSKAMRLPLGPNRLRNLGNSGKFGSPLRTVLQYHLSLNLTGESE